MRFQLSMGYDLCTKFVIHRYFPWISTDIIHFNKKKGSKMSQTVKHMGSLVIRGFGIRGILLARYFIEMSFYLSDQLNNSRHFFSDSPHPHFKNN